MADGLDEKFYDRADAFIHVANAQCHDIGRGKVSASFLYAAARFNAWISATGFTKSEDMAEKRAETIDYFVEQYREMLKENLDDYIRNFARYMQVKAD
jgi:hypothetical protein